VIELNEAKDCCGCGVCVNSCPKKCIKLEEDKEGFLYPHIYLDECVNCNLCEKSCPILNHINRKENAIQSAVIVQNKNHEVIQRSTSGGAFTVIAEYVINREGVVFGVAMQDDYFVRHIAVQNKDELWKFQNSKYVQSFVGNAYSQAKDFLDSGRLVCFSGTPCQIEGLRCYLGKEYKNLILVDVVCRAVPSPGVWKKYIMMEIKKYGKIISVRFRDKTLGYQYSTMEIKNEQGRVYREGIESQPWLRMFFSGMIIRPSCAECKFRSRYRYSDFTIWDCFNVSSFDKKFDEKIGTTRMLIHTEKGKEIFKYISQNFIYKVIDAELAVKDVREMFYSPCMHTKRDMFFEEFSKCDMQELIQKYYPESLMIKIKKYLRLYLNKLGMDIIIRHLFKKDKDYINMRK